MPAPPHAKGAAHPRFKGKIKRTGYWYLWKPDHPNAGKQGYVAEHRVIMEAKIGRLLTRGEVVHHINHDRLDNRPENLHLFASAGQHVAQEHPEAAQHARTANLGQRRSIKTEFKKGFTPWNKGRKMSPEDVEKMRRYRWHIG